MVAVLLVVVGPVRQPDRPQPTTLLPPRSNGKPEAATAVDKLLMMGMRMPETCWAVFKRQGNKSERVMHLVGWFIWMQGLYSDTSPLQTVEVYPEDSSSSKLLLWTTLWRKWENTRQKSSPLTQSQILRTVLKFRWLAEYQMKAAWPKLTGCTPITDICGTDTSLLGTENLRKFNNSISTERVYSGQTAACETVTLFDGRYLLDWNMQCAERWQTAVCDMLVRVTSDLSWRES